MITGVPCPMARVGREERGARRHAARQVLGGEGGVIQSGPSTVRRPTQAKGSWKTWLTSLSAWAAASRAQTSDFGHADLELRLDLLGDVVGQALDLAEPVQLRGRVRKGAAGHA